MTFFFLERFTYYLDFGEMYVGSTAVRLDVHVETLSHGVGWTDVRCKIDATIPKEKWFSSFDRASVETRVIFSVLFSSISDIYGRKKKWRKLIIILIGAYLRNSVTLVDSWPWLNCLTSRRRKLLNVRVAFSITRFNFGTTFCSY